MPEVDQELFRKAKQGDRDAFWRLVVPYCGLVYSVAFGMLKSRERAEDQMHDTLVVAFRSLPNLRRAEKLPSWLYSVTRNHILDEMRREKRLRLASVAAHRTIEVVAVGELMAREAWFERMERAMEQLPEPFRVILGMKYMNDYSCREIGEILELSLSAVKSRLFEARKLLRKRMEAMASDREDTGHEVS
jgi:RNA polymerase sigma-70 factor, ECF subfamily